MSRGSRSRLEVAGIVLLVAALAVLLYRDFARQTADDTRRRTFEFIYATGSWAKDTHGKGTSGQGSTLGFTKLYRVFLQDFLAANGIRSVVDAGCGDWEFSQAIDWLGIDYLGLDLVVPVVQANQRQFGAANIRFAVADIVRDDLPPADLLLVKDVLQHLSQADITRFLAKLPRYRHVLIVNDVRPGSLTAEPTDIPTGGYRPIDLTREPYVLPGVKVLAWNQSGYTKLVIHLQRDNATADARK
jgi:SAM-dependent methyltransferase